MNIIKISLIYILLTFAIIGNAQLKYSVAGQYKGKSAQGFAISRNTAFLFNDEGGCRSFDLKRGEIITDFFIGSAAKNNHVNAVSFGCEYIKGNKYPIIYISENKKPHRCFVENITDSVSQIVQTIEIRRNDIDSIVHDWVVDISQKRLYGVRYGEVINKQTGIRRTHIIGYRLPKLQEGELVVLTKNDVKDEFDVFFSNLLQGASIYKKHLFLPVGLQDGVKDRKDTERAVVVINLKKKIIEKIIDLMDLTSNEPEDMDFYKGKALLYTGQKGGIYEIKLK